MTIPFFTITFEKLIVRLFALKTSFVFIAVNFFPND